MSNNGNGTMSAREYLQKLEAQRVAQGQSPIPPGWETIPGPVAQSYGGFTPHYDPYGEYHRNKVYYDMMEQERVSKMAPHERYLDQQRRNNMPVDPQHYEMLCRGHIQNTMNAQPKKEEIINRLVFPEIPTTKWWSGDRVYELPIWLFTNKHYFRWDENGVGYTLVPLNMDEFTKEDQLRLTWILEHETKSVMQETGIRREGIKIQRIGEFPWFDSDRDDSFLEEGGGQLWIPLELTEGFVATHQHNVQRLRFSPEQEAMLASARRDDERAFNSKLMEYGIMNGNPFDYWKLWSARNKEANLRAKENPTMFKRPKRGNIWTVGPDDWRDTPEEKAQYEKRAIQFRKEAAAYLAKAGAEIPQAQPQSQLQVQPKELPKDQPKKMQPRVLKRGQEKKMEKQNIQQNVQFSEEPIYKDQSLVTRRRRAEQKFKEIKLGNLTLFSEKSYNTNIKTIPEAEVARCASHGESGEFWKKTTYLNRTGADIYVTDRTGLSILIRPTTNATEQKLLLEGMKIENMQDSFIVKTSYYLGSKEIVAKIYNKYYNKFGGESTAQPNSEDEYVGKIVVQICSKAGEFKPMGFVYSREVDNAAINEKPIYVEDLDLVFSGKDDAVHPNSRHGEALSKRYESTFIEKSGIEAATMSIWIINNDNEIRQRFVLMGSEIVEVPNYECASQQNGVYVAVTNPDSITSQHKPEFYTFEQAEELGICPSREEARAKGDVKGYYRKMAEELSRDKIKIDYEQFHKKVEREEKIEDRKAERDEKRAYYENRKMEAEAERDEKRAHYENRKMDTDARLYETKTKGDTHKETHKSFWYILTEIVKGTIGLSLILAKHA